MKITNKFNLPEAYVQAVTKDFYDRGDIPFDYSVTELIQPPRIVQLKRRHDDELEEDVSDMNWKLLGNVAHEILRQNEQSHEITEQRLYMTILERVVSGMSDNYNAHRAVISDYKITSVWKYLHGDVSEWEQQLNMLAHLRRLDGYQVNGIEIIASLRDYRRGEAFQNPEYPQASVITVPIKLWKSSEAHAFMVSRVAAHIGAEVLEDHKLPICTKEERWESGDVYRIMIPGGKKASAVEFTKEEAEAKRNEMNAKKNEPKYTPKGKLKAPDKRPDYVVDYVPGRPKRCTDGWCPVREFCNYYKETVLPRFPEKTEEEETKSIDD